ncbi:general secretion pathway protein D [Haloferula luteola]|uniref:General secretion pathway protein D n=1 Tax=Haloferula luteola TaxID=595692 RepID=A0A840V4B9_9BACT|nr:Amuc_1098 family type IV pilus outer membrane protein [Haloferula luteola]MBB5351896.1 general secretion pathway protein D [Haloferula luteola]
MQKTPSLPHRTTVAALLAAAAVTPVFMNTAQAGEGGSYGSYSSLAEKEMIRRQQQVTESDRLRDEAREAYSKQEYKEAYDKYKQALQILPDAPLLADRREFLTASLGDAAVALSEEYRRFGKYDEARTMLNDVLEENPNNFDAKRELEWIDDPIRTNPALTEEHSENVDEVRRGLYMAQGYYDLGQFDEAHEAYEKVLRIDKYNTAARRGMEKVAAAKTSYYQAAYDQTRAELLAEVDKAWELTVPPDAPAVDINGGSPVTKSAGSTYILQKLRNIVIPVIDFEDTSVEEAIDYLRVRSIELDTMEMDPTRKGINFFIRKPRTGGGDAGLDAGSESGPAPGSQRISELRLRNVPLAEALNYICEATRLRWSVDDFAVTIKPATEVGEDLFTRTYNVPPDFLARISGGGDSDSGGGSDDPFATGGDTGGSALTPRMSITDALKANGVKFPADASAQFFAANSTLLVRNTPTNLDMVEQIVSSTVTDAPKQVKISTKFVEVAQENTDELGFDWILSPFATNFADDIFLGGGTTGSGQSRTNSDFISPLVDIATGGGTTLNGVPAASNQDVYNIIGAGNRSGDGAINRDSIAALLNNPNRAAESASAAPGILSLTGLFTNGQVQMIMRGLNQKKGTDLMTAPSVTARSGEKATIEIIREFIYPTEYEPPELPNSVGTGTSFGGGGLLGSSASSFPVTPATPTSFETRNTGVTLEIAPNIGSNDFVIDLNFAPEIVEFEGFVNYGSPIQSPSTDLLGNPTTVVITENRIEMPVFSKRSVNTALTIFDGYTVAVGGLMREDVQNVEDKVPILGDLPLIGRLFQSKAENHIKSNLIIFVTAEIIDATGRPINRGQTPTSADGGVLPDLPPVQ